MEKLITFFSILFFVATSNGQNNLDIKKLEKDFVKVQRNNQKEGRSIYACKFELTNAQYNLFLDDLKKSGNTTLYTSCQRDSLGWKKFDFDHNDPYVKSYAYHQVYSNYPVVCISYESALAYCEWLTAKYKESGNGKYNGWQQLIASHKHPILGMEVSRTVQKAVIIAIFDVIQSIGLKMVHFIP